MDINAFLEKHSIQYQRFDHLPVFTCEEARQHVPDMPGAETKNLFVKDKKGRNLFLVVLGYDKKVDLKALSNLLEVKDLSFCSPERLMEHLGVEPGSVTILGLANDPGGKVKLIIDRQLWEASAFRCHPLVNTATLLIEKAQLEKFISATAHSITLVDLPA
jgi:Ala-tRNA(Pro) deacylase